MKNLHLFEFMDLSWLPNSLRLTLRDLLECVNSFPFSRYYTWAADCIVKEACTLQPSPNRLLELGAGTAPITRRLVRRSEVKHCRLVISDRHPDREAYTDLQRRYPERIDPVFDSVDFSRPAPGGVEARRTLAFLSATLHHVPPSERAPIIARLVESGYRVLVIEPLRRNVLSAALVMLTIIPAALLPLRYLTRPGRWRRALWCWLIPVAPFLFWWDGLISCLREWPRRQWEAALAQQSLRAVIVEKHRYQIVRIEPAAAELSVAA